jgi:hypothetical protein
MLGNNRTKGMRAESSRALIPFNGVPNEWSKCPNLTRSQWLTPVILATWEAQIGKAQSQPGQIVCETSSPK